MKELLIIDDAREEGREIGQLQILTKLVRDGLLSTENAAASIGISLEEFMAYLATNPA